MLVNCYCEVRASLAPCIVCILLIAHLCMWGCSMTSYHSLHSTYCSYMYASPNEYVCMYFILYIINYKSHLHTLAYEVCMAQHMAHCFIKRKCQLKKSRKKCFTCSDECILIGGQLYRVDTTSVFPGKTFGMCTDKIRRDKNCKPSECDNGGLQISNTTAWHISDSSRPLIYGPFMKSSFQWHMTVGI
jgi:hypothetical protein